MYPFRVLRSVGVRDDRRVASNDPLSQYLGRLPAEELRKVLVEACREGTKSSSSLVRLNVYQAAMKLRGATPTEVEVVRTQHDYNRWTGIEAVLTALWWEWCTTGRAVPRFRDTGASQPTIVESIDLTPAGLAALRDDIPPHPMSDAYRGGLDGLDDEMKARLEDAQLCYKASLPRAAMVMVGIAYEHTIEVVAEAVGIGLRFHAQRLEKLRDTVEKFKLPKDTPDLKELKDQRTDALNALTVARVVTIERNSAGHAGAYERPSLELEEFLWRAPHWLRKLSALPALLKAPPPPES